MADTVTEAVTKAATKTAGGAGKAATKTTGTAGTAGKAATTAKRSARKATGTAKATKAAKAGRVVDARKAAAQAGLGDGVATDAIAKAEALHYDVEVNKRGLSVKALTRTLNDRWDNGWRLAHVLEQRGNTVLVFEKRS